MSDYLECLEDVIGISQNNCPCFDDGRQDEYSESRSGYFMDNPDYGLPLNYPATVKDCQHNNLWELATEARRAGIVQFVTEYGAAMASSRWIRKASPYAGFIGSQSQTGVLNISEDVIGMKFVPTKHRGNRITIHNLDVYGSGPAALLLEVFTETELLTNPTPEPIGAFTDAAHNAAGMLHRYLPIDGKPVEALFSSDGNTPENIYILASRDGWTMKNNKFKCSTCGRSRLEAWMTHVTATGVVASTNALMPEAVGTTNTNGLRPNVTISCGNSWLCQNFDYSNDDWGRVLAELILLYANRQLISFILISDNVNVYTAARSEELIDRRTYINEIIAKRMPWLAKYTPNDIQDCYRCLSRSTRKSVLV